MMEGPVDIVPEDMSCHNASYVLHSNTSYLLEDHNNTGLWLTGSNNSDHLMMYDIHELAEKCQELAKYMRFRLVIDVFVVSFFIMGGFIGNTLAFLVMRADNMNNTVSYLLQALAVADNTYLLLCVFLQIMKALTECSNWIPALKYTYPYMEPYIWPLASIVQTTCVWLVVQVTFDRYIAICHPFNTTYKGSRSRARKMSFVIVILAVVYNIPRFFEQTTVYMLEYCNNVTLLTNRHSEMRKNPMYFIIYKTCMYFVFRVVIPFGTLTVLNVKLFMVLKGATESHAALTRTAPRSDSFTRILVVVVTVFIVCELPTFIVRAVLTAGALTGVKFNMWYYATISNLLLTVNSSINCLIYCISGPRFRKILRRLFCRTCMSSKGQHHLMTTDDHSNINGTLTTITQHLRRSTVRKSHREPKVHQALCQDTNL